MDLNFALLLVFFIFWILSFWTLKKFKTRALIRKSSEWLIDLISLIQQGFLFPLIQTYILFNLFKYFYPQLKGVIALNFGLSFILQFVVIDYFYYWNHRLLHNQKLWSFHRIHHSSKKLDLWVTSRNSFWSSFLIIYLWIHAIFIYLLNDSKGFIWAIAIGNSLDLWRHSGFRFPPLAERFFGLFLILPHDHEWHHSSTITRKNFGANFNLWDKLHGTYLKSSARSELLGETIKDNFWTQWLFPWRLKP